MISSALIVININVVLSSSDGLAWTGKNVTTPEAKWVSALQKLSRSIFGSLPGNKLETVLLTSNSGLINCNKFPGPVFGMTPAGFSRDPETLNVWTHYQLDKADAIFPITAREWYDSWAITNKLSRRRYFFCPISNTKGYLGYKTKEDPVDDNGGVDWDMNQNN